MSRSLKLIFSVMIMGILFLGGFYAGSVSKAEITKEIKIGYQNEENLKQVKFDKVFTDVDNPFIIDDFLMIYLNGEKIENVTIDVKNPDVYIELNNPMHSVRLIDTKLWFETNGAIIGKRDGDQMVYLKIDDSDAAYIKNAIGYEKADKD